MSRSAARRGALRRTAWRRILRAIIAALCRAAPDARLALRDEGGSILVLAAVAMAAVIGMAAYTIDAGTWFHDQRHLQLQADAAALAGADQFLANPEACPEPEEREAESYGYANLLPTEKKGEAEKPGKAKVPGVTITPEVVCPGKVATSKCKETAHETSYICVTAVNEEPTKFFAPIKPKEITAQARVNLLQVTEAGGKNVLPYAITEEEAKECCDVHPTQIQVNSQETKEPSQSLVCNGSMTKSATEETGEGSQLMKEFQEKGCLTVTKISACVKEKTCGTKSAQACTKSEEEVTKSKAPPSCLAEFNKVSEGKFDEGLVGRFSNGAKKPGEGTCANTNGAPMSVDYGALYNGQPFKLPSLHPSDPRVITVFVVPTKIEGKRAFEYQATTGPVRKIPIVGYAAFYVAGWDHDKCNEEAKGTKVEECVKLKGKTGKYNDSACTKKNEEVEGEFELVAHRKGEQVCEKASPPKTGKWNNNMCNMENKEHKGEWELGPESLKGTACVRVGAGGKYKDAVCTKKEAGEYELKTEFCPGTSTAPVPPAGLPCDPLHPTGKTEHGAVWGFFVKRVTPGTGEVAGTGPCEPAEGEAASNFCVSELAQ
jgi:Flp pilus assembly protein TadG